MGRMSARGGSNPGTRAGSLKIVRRPPFVRRTAAIFRFKTE